MVNVAPGDVPIAVVTVTLAVPGVAIRLAGTAAVSWLTLMNVVVSAGPFHFAFAPEPKLVPLIVRVKAAPPAVAELGLRLVIVGGGRFMVNVAPADVPPVVVTDRNRRGDWHRSGRQRRTQAEARLQRGVRPTYQSTTELLRIAPHHIMQAERPRQECLRDDTRNPRQRV